MNKRVWGSQISFYCFSSGVGTRPSKANLPRPSKIFLFINGDSTESVSFHSRNLRFETHTKCRVPLPTAKWRIAQWDGSTDWPFPLFAVNAVIRDGVTATNQRVNRKRRWWQKTNILIETRAPYKRTIAPQFHARSQNDGGVSSFALLGGLHLGRTADWFIKWLVYIVFRFHPTWLARYANERKSCSPSHQVLRGLFFVDARTLDFFLWWAKLQPAEAISKQRRSGSLKQSGRPKTVPISGHRVFQDSDLYVQGY